MRWQLLLISGVITFQIILLMAMAVSLFKGRYLSFSSMVLVLFVITHLEVFTISRKIEVLDDQADDFIAKIEKAVDDVKTKIVNFKVFG